jgi:hypothetical protein
MTATQLGWLGFWLFVGSSIVIVVELAVAAVWSARLARRGQALAVALQAQRALIDSDLARLRVSMDETRVLWRPYRRILRILRHPLVVALIGSYRRRWFSSRRSS